MLRIRFWLPVLLLYMLSAGVDCISSVHMVLPPVVAVGSSATFLCLFDLQQAPLYSVKWYRGTFEFYRFVPKYQPPKRAFPFPGLAVDLSSSSDQQVMLVDIPLHLSGRYTCEVSADEPSFTTNIAYDELSVIDLNSLSPNITLEKRYTSKGYFLDANCTTKSSEPEVILTFFINNRAVADKYVNTSSSSALLQLNMSGLMGEQNLSFKCVASLLNTLQVASDTVTVCLQLRRHHRSGTSVQQFSSVAFLLLIFCQSQILVYYK